MKDDDKADDQPDDKDDDDDNEEDKAQQESLPQHCFAPKNPSSCLQACHTPQNVTQQQLCFQQDTETKTTRTTQSFASSTQMTGPTLSIANLACQQEGESSSIHPNFVIHVGPPKTVTTSSQRALEWVNSTLFSHEGILHDDSDTLMGPHIQHLCKKAMSHLHAAMLHGTSSITGP